MVNLEHIREHRPDYEQSVRNRNLDPAALQLDKIFALADERKELIGQIDALRAERNQVSRQVEHGAGSMEHGARGKQIKDQLKALEEKLAATEADLRRLNLRLPNIVSPDMPVGKGPQDNKVIREWGTKPAFDFKPKDHLALGLALDLIDTEAAARVSGSRFYYLKNELVLMQIGLFSHVMKKLAAKGFTAILPPALVKAAALEGTGYFPFETTQVFEVTTPGAMDAEKLFLTGTSEQAIVSYHSGTMFKANELPKKYVGISPCFRTEVGSWGKDVRGIRRVHQFEKVEMILFTAPETSQSLMQDALALEEEILQDLELPYRVLDMCTADVGMPTFRKFDLEVWLPSVGEYMEVMSNSDLAQFHSRRLNIKYKTPDGKTDFAHTISATAITNTRPLLAILENYQQADGSIRVPKILQNFLNQETIRPKA